MGKIRIKGVDAFTTTPQGGNSAGVILEGQRLSEQQMKSVARELHFSETVFLLPSSRSGTDCRMRSFTPQSEMSVSGHAMLAGLHVLAEEGMLGMTKKENYRLQIDSVAGVIAADILRQEQPPLILLETKPPTLTKATQYKTDLLRLLNINLSDFDNRLTIMRNEFLFVGLRRLHALFTMKPNFAALGGFLETRSFNGICIYTTETVERESLVHSRFFAPHLGLAEDPVTQSTHPSLALIFFEQGLLLPKDGKCLFRGEQGDAIGRRGRVSVELHVEELRPVMVKVGGSAVTVLDGELLVND
ncbi:MAG TPA: PhzF family phenazine biosynthesis protein [Bacteroidota bacterium]|nr:PhzF family phenazine biosynthesis protein [Bacteroidota bacterium]